MKRKIMLQAALCVCLMMMLAGCASRKQSIVVLYENDVHCAVSGYAQLAGLRDAVADTAWASVVSSGDFVQGGTLGAMSKGQYVIDVMRHVGYDAVALGNHEFDFNVPHQKALLTQLGAPIVCSNFSDVATNNLVYAPYVIKRMGRKKVAFVGAVTPTTMQSEAYSFYDESGKQLYDLHPDNFTDLVQKAVDEARSKGADYVLLLAHLGETPTTIHSDSHSVVSRMHGINAVLDAHSHSVIPSETVLDSEGKPVLITQTGTQFLNIGKLLIDKRGRISTTLVPLSDIPSVNAKVQSAVDSISAVVENVVNRQVCASEVDLLIYDEKGLDMARIGESNSGDLVADAFRMRTGADIGAVNGGGIRTEVKKRNMTYGDMVSLLPYDNMLCVAEVTGERIMKMLKENTCYLPEEDGQFPQVSGLKFTVSKSTHELTDVMVLDGASGKYVPIDLQRTYTLATTDYAITGGGFHGSLKGVKIVKECQIRYSDALIEYVTRNLGGHIGKEYAAPQGRITIVE